MLVEWIFARARCSPVWQLIWQWVERNVYRVKGRSGGGTEKDPLTARARANKSRAFSRDTEALSALVLPRGIAALITALETCGGFGR